MTHNPVFLVRVQVGPLIPNKIMNVDKEHIVGYFQNIIHICDRTTVGNLSHQMSSIRITYSYIADKVKEQYGENMVYNNLMHVVELAAGATTGNIAHKVATIKGLCQRNIDFINEFGLE